MYLVFLLYAGAVISAGILSAFAMLLQLLTGSIDLKTWFSGFCFITLLWMLRHVRDFWA